MKRRLLITLSITGACAAGVVCGELLVRLHPFRSAAGILFNRGHLLAFAQGHGVYKADLRRALVELRYANGTDEKDEATKTRGGDLGFFSESRMPSDFFSPSSKYMWGRLINQCARAWVFTLLK